MACRFSFLRLAALGVLLLGVTRPAAAQLGLFQEIAIPTAPANLYVGPGNYYQGVEVVVRRGQQGLRFDLGSNIAQYPKVRIDGGAWTYLHQGSNTQAVTWSASQIAALGNPGLYPVEVNYGGNGTTYAFNLVVVPAAQRAFQAAESNVPRYPDGALVTRQHTIIVWSGPEGSTGSATLDRPVLVVEGIDATNENGPEAYYALGFRRGVRSLFPRAQAQGADIAILDLGDGGRRMQPNAAVVRRAVEILRQYSTDRRRNLDVIGVSMGGVLARYALAQMEQDGALYGVDRFLSVDAPQQGAVIHGGLQSDIRDRLEPVAYPPALNRPAGRQLLRVNAFDTASPTEHQSFYAELRALNGNRGYPTRTTNVGVSFGTPTDQAAGARWGRLDVTVCWESTPPIPYPWPDGTDCSDRDYHVGGETALAGSWLPVEVTQLWGRRFFGLIRYELLRFENVANPTFIPYTSALDIVNGASRFDAPTIAVPAGLQPSFHNVVPDTLVTPLLRRLGYEVPAPSSVAISGPTTLTTGVYGRWRASTPDPGAGYQYNWQYRIRFPNGCGGGGGPVVMTQQQQQAPGPGGDTTDPSLIPCGVWHDGDGSGAIFTHRVSSSVWLDLRVKASNAAGASVWSPTRTVCVGACNGLTQPGEGEGAGSAAKTGGGEWPTAIASVHPNPLRAGDGGTISFSVAESGRATLRVFDTLGREVADVLSRDVEAGTHVAPLPSSLPAGSYVVRLEAGGVVATRLVTILR